MLPSTPVQLEGYTSSRDCWKVHSRSKPVAGDGHSSLSRDPKGVAAANRPPRRTLLLDPNSLHIAQGCNLGHSWLQKRVPAMQRQHRELPSMHGISQVWRFKPPPPGIFNRAQMQAACGGSLFGHASPRSSRRLFMHADTDRLQLQGTEFARGHCMAERVLPFHTPTTVLYHHPRADGRLVPAFAPKPQKTGIRCAAAKKVVCVALLESFPRPDPCSVWNTAMFYGGRKLSHGPVVVIAIREAKSSEPVGRSIASVVDESRNRVV
jgi:hypothetical protein